METPETPDVAPVPDASATPDTPRSLWELAGEVTPDDRPSPGVSVPTTHAVVGGAAAAVERPAEPSAPPPAPVAPRLLARVIDTFRGAPAEGIAVVVETISEAGLPALLGTATTGADGTASALPADVPFAPGYFRITFDVAQYFADQMVRSCYPAVSILVQVDDASRDYVVPLLLSPNGFSTYRA